MNRDLRIVTIGGGTGNSVLLRGLKKYTTALSTIVTVADDGGGSGKLREDLGMLPPGDIRACLLALANTEPAMENLLSYRFKEGSLKGQSMGNLFLAAMNDIYGDFNTAIKETGNVLAISGKVLPMTLDNVTLYAELEDGTIIQGESNIPFKTREKKGKIRRVFIKPQLSDPLEESIDEILKADLIIIGPGSLYTSIMPNLLVKKIAQALIKTSAKIYYISNVMTQAGETDGYTVSDHVHAIEEHIGQKIIDCVVVNDEKVSDILEKEYFEKENTCPVYLQAHESEQLQSKGYQIICGNFAHAQWHYICHNADKIAQTIWDDFMKTC